MREKIRFFCRVASDGELILGWRYATVLAYNCDICVALMVVLQILHLLEALSTSSECVHRMHTHGGGGGGQCRVNIGMSQIYKALEQ